MKNKNKREYKGSLLYQRMTKEKQLHQSEKEGVVETLENFLFCAILIFLIFSPLLLGIYLGTYLMSK